MATEVTTRCTCDWCGKLIKQCDGDASSRYLWFGRVKLEHTVAHMGWWGDDLCHSCTDALVGLRAARKQKGPQP